MIYERQVGSRRVRVECDGMFRDAANDVLDTLSKLALNGSQLAPGQRVRFGWSILTLQPEPDGALRVCEPDFDSDPLSSTRATIDVTLSVLLAQANVARRAGVTPVDVGFEQSVITQTGAWNGERIALFRSASLDDLDSGWFIADPERIDTPPAESELESIRVYNLLKLWPVALSVFILPVGSTAEVDRERVLHVWDERGKELWSSTP